jgi:hypothetical protein
VEAHPSGLLIPPCVLSTKVVGPLGPALLELRAFQAFIHSSIFIKDLDSVWLVLGYRGKRAWGMLPEKVGSFQ